MLCRCWYCVNKPKPYIPKPELSLVFPPVTAIVHPNVAHYVSNSLREAWRLKDMELICEKNFSPLI